MIRWDPEKDRWLRINRGISFGEISDMILAKRYLEIEEHPTRANQLVFVLRVHDYTWAVPFVFSSDDTIFLKTAYPSRKLHRRYGRRSQ